MTGVYAVCVVKREKIGVMNGGCTCWVQVKNTQKIRQIRVDGMNFL